MEGFFLKATRLLTTRWEQSFFELLLAFLVPSATTLKRGYNHDKMDGCFNNIGFGLNRNGL
jgi:hypothetical protein